MSKKDMLGPVVRALVGIPEKDLGIFLDIANKIGSKDGEQWRVRLAEELRKGAVAQTRQGHVLVIDRTIPFNPATFIANNWMLKEQNKRSLTVTKVDFEHVSFETCLRAGESSIDGLEKLKRHVEAGHILGDAKIGQVLYEEKEHKTLEYLYKEKGITWFELPGTVLLGPSRNFDLMYLYRGSKGWDCGYGLLYGDRHAGRPSLVLGHN